MLVKLIAFSAAAFVLVVSVAHAQPPPNVLLIIGDDQGWADYGFMGHPVIDTPNLDRLAAEGLTFTRGYVPSSLCRPSLATLATGLYTHQHRVTGNDPPDIGTPQQWRALDAEWTAIFQQSPPVAGLLGRAGYLSHQSGKWWEGPCRCGEFTAGMTHGDPDRGGRHGDEGLRIGRETLQPIYDFVDGVGERPFFLWYAPFLPHLPHNPPQRLLDRYRDDNLPPELAAYFAMCTWLDETVGELLDFLEDRGLRENTLVLFLADNGWVQPLEGGEGWGNSYGAPKGKRSPYDGGLRTPIIINWPGRVSPARIDTPVSSVDIVPTILAAAGLDTPADMPGVNLLDPAAVQSRDAIFGAIFAHDAVDIRRPETSLQFRWTIALPWKLILPHAPNVTNAAPELYNLADDPHETRNLAAAHTSVVDAYRHSLNAWWNPEEP